jgi:hypothetical protein
MRKIGILGLVGVLAVLLAGCGGGDPYYYPPPPPPPGPGLLGIEDTENLSTRPLLTVEYALPFSPATITVDIYSDYLSDGDIANDPYLGFIVTRWPDTRGTIFFGVDSGIPNIPFYRSFLDFPLDGSTGWPVIPLDASIVSATLDLFVNSVSFADTIPADIDLVFFSPATGLTPDLYYQVPYASRPVDFFSSDQSQFVPIDVTSLMAEAQYRGFSDFQVRFSIPGY